jgi:MFS family permease
VLLGGTLTQWLGWRWVLFVNMPIAMACAAGAAVLLPRDPMPSAVRGLDVWGAVSVSSGLALLVLGFSRLADRPMITLGALAVGVALLGIFLAVEARAAQPLVPLDTLRHGRLGVANLVGTSFGICMGGLLFVLTLYMQDVLGYSPVQGGLAFLPHALVVVVASGTVSRLINRAGPEVGVLAGMALMFGGFELIALEITGSNTPFVTVLLPGTVLAGLGVACLLVSASGVVTATAPPGQEGLVSGLFNTAQQVGVSVGLPVLAAVVQAGMPASAAPRSDTAITAFRWALHGGALVAAAGMVLALLLLSRHDASTRRRPTSRAASSETPAT